MQGLWQSKKTGYVKDYKIRKIKQKHFFKDKAKRIIKEIENQEEIYINTFKRKENNYLTIEKENYLNVYIVTFEKDNKKYIKKGYINPITKGFEFNEETYIKLDREKYTYCKKYSLFNSMPKDLKNINDNRYIYEVITIGITKNIFLNQINLENEKLKEEEITYWNKPNFYKNKLITKHFRHELIAKAYTGDSKFDIDGLTKEEKKIMRRLETKKIIKEEMKLFEDDDSYYNRYEMD